jgi:sugar phosphate isomerase/epimerase
MILGYNTNGLQNHRLDDALRLLADSGFHAVALTLDVHHLDPFRCGAREVGQVAALLAGLGLHPVIETGGRFLLDPRQKHEPTLMTRGEEARVRRLDFYRRAAVIGRDLGAKVVSFWSGVDRRPGPDSRAWLLEGVRRTCELVRATGLVPALEPEPGMAIATVADLRSLSAELGPERPSLTLDIGHLYVTDGCDVEDAIGEAVPDTVQVHLEDMRRGVHEHLVPGNGDVDFCSVLAALSESYVGPVCFELSRSSHAAPECLEICRAVWEKAIWR